MSSTLLLNADATPISLIPMSTISWQDACKFMYTGHAAPLHFYDDWVVRGQKMEYQVPSVMILKQQVHVKRRLKCEESKDADAPSSRLMFLRDGYICQYCHKSFSYKELTVDHVLPRKFGGKTKWENVTTACSPCNHKRGHDVTIQPKNKPFRPTYGHLIKMMRKFPLIINHSTWNYYLGWSEDLVEIRTPNKFNNSLSFFDDKRIKVSNLL